MSEVLDAPPTTDLYEEDFYLWTQQQAELLRAARFDQVDLANLIEEVESLGRSDRREVFSRAEQMLRHLLKLQYSRATDPRRGWRSTVREQRAEMELVITPTLRHELSTLLPTRYVRARTRAVEDLAEHGEPTDHVPATCPYTLEQILDPDWWPESIHGIDDRPPTTAD